MLIFYFHRFPLVEAVVLKISFTSIFCVVFLPSGWCCYCVMVYYWKYTANYREHMLHMKKVYSGYVQYVDTCCLPGQKQLPLLQ